MEFTDDPDENNRLEEALFELKQFFVSKPVLFKTFHGKLKRLEELFFELIETENQLSNNSSVFEIPGFSNEKSLLDHYQQYFRCKNQLKQYLVITDSPVEVRKIVLQLINLEQQFCGLFPEMNWTDEVVVFGVEPDPMILQNALQVAAKNGCNTIQELFQQKDMLPKSALLALKRLSLLSKYIYE